MDSWEQLDSTLTFTSINIKVSSTYVCETLVNTVKLHEKEMDSSPIIPGTS